jgi:hypothetical protein
MKSEPTENGTETLAGLVERVTFHNEENGFAVLRVKARGKRDLVTVVGHAAVISAGEFIPRRAGIGAMIASMASSSVHAFSRR